MILKSFAKMNLGLEIKKKRIDGFHNLNTIMQSLNLFDIIRISKINLNKIFVECNKNVCKMEENLAYKAAKIIFDLINPNFGIKIKIQKNIPTGAGLGGGSSNAAAVLFGMNKILNLNFPKNKIIEICEKLGSDVPFCYFGGTMLCRGKGEILSKINSLPECQFLLKFNNQKNYTKKLFKQFDDFIDNNLENNKFKIKMLKDAILSGNIEKLSRKCFNNFEQIIKVPHGWHLTGSGSAIFKIVNKNYINLDNNILTYKPVNYGVEIIEDNWN